MHIQIPSSFFKIWNKIKNAGVIAYFSLALPTISYLYRTWIGYMYRKKNQTSGAMYP